MAIKEKLNGYARWAIVTLAVGGLIFNSGVLYNHVQHLTEQVEELKTSCASLDEKIDHIMFTLAEKSRK